MQISSTCMAGAPRLALVLPMTRFVAVFQPVQVAMADSDWNVPST